MTNIPNSSRIGRRALLALAAGAPIAGWAQSACQPMALSPQEALRRVSLAFDTQTYVGLDMVDVQAVLEDRAVHTSCAVAYGPTRAADAAHIAISMFRDRVSAATGALVLVSAASPGFKLWESRAAYNTVRAAMTPHAYVIYGTLPAQHKDARCEVTLLLGWAPPHDLDRSELQPMGPFASCI